MPDERVTRPDWFDKTFVESHRDWLRELVFEIVHEVMETEVTSLVGAGHGERSKERTTHRNGYRERQWTTRVGDIDLHIPKLRAGSYFPSFLEPRRRAEKALINVIQEAYVQGVSTRRVERLCRQMGIDRMDKSFVSRLAKGIEEDVQAFKSRPLEAEFPYVFVDARYEKVRHEGRVVSLAVMVAVGVRMDGHREVLGFETGIGERYKLWRSFLEKLIERGLRGVQLVVSDAHEGLKRAIGECFTGSSWQRCRVHFMRSMLAHVSRRYQPVVSALLKTIFAQPTIEEAQAELRRVVEMLRPRFSVVADLVEGAEQEVLTYMSFPVEHWSKLHSTNMLERLMRTIKARTRVVSIFPNAEALNRLTGAILIEENEEWMEARRYISEASMVKLKAPAALPPRGEQDQEIALQVA
ncbi:MAG: IS256 family transposase [Desulfovibrionales bacterium]